MAVLVGEYVTMHKHATSLSTVATIVALLATLSAGVGGYYDVKSRGEQTAAALQQLRDKQESFERIALTRWAKVDDVLSELLARGIRNETKIDAILDALRTHMNSDYRKSPTTAGVGGLTPKGDSQ